MTAYEMLQKSQQSQPLNAAPTITPDPVLQAVATNQIAANLITGGQASDIYSKCLLVYFACSIPGNEKVDRKVTEEVKVSKAMGKDSGKWDKTIFPPSTYKALSAQASAARTWHYENTLAYPMPGLQLLPVLNYQKYCEGMRDWKRQMENARDEFIAKLPDIRLWAQVEHNGSYDASLYEEARIRSKFSFSINFTPLPASDHWASDLKSMLGVDASSVDETVKQAAQAAQAEVWERLITPLRNIQTILSKKENGDRTKITDSLLGNLREIAQSIPALNISNDPRLTQFANDAQAAFSGFTKADLADNASSRQEAIKKANDILRKMTGIVP